MMAAKEHSIFRIASNLAMACLVSGLVIGSVYYVTAPVAAQKAEMMKQDSMKALVQDADSFQPVDGHEGWFAAMKGGKAEAYIVPSETKGYGGRIRLLVAVTADGRVMDFNILEHFKEYRLNTISVIVLLTSHDVKGSCGFLFKDTL